MNYLLPIIKHLPNIRFPRKGDFVSWRQIMSGGDRPMYVVQHGWRLIGWRHDPTTSRQNLAVLAKGDRQINVSLDDIL